MQRSNETKRLEVDAYAIIGATTTVAMLAGLLDRRRDQTAEKVIFPEGYLKGKTVQSWVVS